MKTAPNVSVHSKDKYSGTLPVHPGTLQTMTSTKTWKWKLCLAKYRDLHKSTKKDSHHHENVEAIQLLNSMGIARRLQREKPFELV
jgi:hypothetical protein